MIEKAKSEKLRGWSFGFEALKESEEALKNGLKRRFIEEMNLMEISIIDERKLPCYVGTSIETRADKQSKIEYRGDDFSAKMIINSKNKLDYSKFEEILQKVGKI